MKVYQLSFSHASLLDPDSEQLGSGISEAQIWINFKNGSEEAYRYIYTNHFSTLFNYGRQFCPNTELVKDCIQEVFVTIWQSKEQLSNTDSIKYYLFRALKRSIAQAMKKAHKRHQLYAQVRPFESLPSIEERMILSQAADEQKSKIRQAVNALSDKQREAIFLLFYENLSYPQIADLLSIEVKTARNLVGKALQSLRKQLKFVFFFGFTVLMDWLLQG